MASLFKRGKRYFVRTYVNGKARDIATKTSNRKLAEKIKQKIEYEKATGVLETATRTQRVSALLWAALCTFAMHQEQAARHYRL